MIGGTWPNARTLRRNVARFDRRVDRSFDHLRGKPLADRLFYAASELGDFSLIWLIAGAARALGSDRDLHAAIRLGASAAFETVLVNVGVKSLFRRRRPPFDIIRPHHLRRPHSSSFPSGHATSAFMAAVVLGEDDPLAPLYFAVATVVALSRIHVRIHHATDVLAGAAFGLALGAAIRRIAPLPELPSPLPELMP